MIHFTRYVGVSPGTTTMEMNGVPGLGVCPPGYYTPIDVVESAPLAPSQGDEVAPAIVDKNIYMPYGTESKLMGLRGLGAPGPGGWFALAFGLAFAGVLSYVALKR